MNTYGHFSLKHHPRLSCVLCFVTLDVQSFHPLFTLHPGELANAHPFKVARALEVGEPVISLVQDRQSLWGCTDLYSPPKQK